MAITHDGQVRVTVVGATEVMSRNNRPANIPHPLEPIVYWYELDDKPSPSEYPKIVRPPRDKDPDMLSVFKQQGEVLTAFHPDLKQLTGMVIVSGITTEHSPSSCTCFILHAQVSMMCAKSSDVNYIDKVFLQPESFFAHSSWPM